jgi:hypothetical protein
MVAEGWRAVSRAGRWLAARIGLRWSTFERPVAERPLSEWELLVVAAMVDVGGPGAETIRESVPYLVRTGGCGCGCPSFNVRDGRFPPQPHEMERFSTGHTSDGSASLDFYLGPDGRPLCVDIETDGKDLPAPDTLIITRV